MPREGNGGGIALLLTMTLRGTSEVSHNWADTYAGGVYLDAYEDAMLIREESAKITANACDASGGGGVAKTGVRLRMSGSSAISHNRGSDHGGSVSRVLPVTTDPCSIELHGNVLVADNVGVASRFRSGGGMYSQSSVAKVLMDGNALITLNVASSGGVFGFALDIRDKASIIGNTVDTCAGCTVEAGSKQCGV